MLLVIEGTTVALILIVSVVILIRLATGTAPNGNTLDFSVFSVPGGTGTSALFLGVVFGFLSFAGFEAAATLGEEAQEPRRNIPRAILGVAIFGGLYYVFVTAIEVMGFGTDKQGVADFIASGRCSETSAASSSPGGSASSSPSAPRSAPSAARWPA